MSNNTESTQQYDAVALFSGGLDSILAVKVIQEQGLRVKCLHFVTPFFGKPRKKKYWEKIFDIDIQNIDVGQEYVDMMAAGPSHGFGKVLNPCVNCKILMARKAREWMDKLGAKFIITGEVVGQRPMSQRRDTLDVIIRDADVKDVLVRPLCAKRLKPTPAEEAGYVDRERLLNLSGRGRKGQMELAQKYQLKEIPTPAGGCTLAEMESSRRFWPVFTHSPAPVADDFYLSNVGRQYWAGAYWLSIGRNRQDNETLERLCKESDLVFKTLGFPGPLCIGRQFPDAPWSEEVISDAAAFVASFSPKAVKSGAPVEVQVTHNGESKAITVRPSKENTFPWAEPTWEDAKAEKLEKGLAR